jgi:hypothetical protein
MENIIINKEGNFKGETISSIPLGNNNIILNNNSNFDLKKGGLNNIKPMLSSNTGSINLPDGKKVKIRPSFGKKVPMNTFSMISNKKKNIESDDSDKSLSSDGSYQSESDDILSNNNASGNNLNDDDDGELDDDDEDDYSSIESQTLNANNKSRRNNNASEDYSEDGDDDDEEEDDEDASVKPKKQKTYEEIQQEKQQILFNLERLQKQGYPPSKRYSMASSFEDMQFEFDRLKKQRDVEKSIKFSRKILMAAISGIEFLNGKFDPFDVKLEGWSENIMENVSDYDEVFEELHEKYSDSVKMAPELKLIAMVAGSGFMFHLTNSLFKSASPKLSDILKQNPDIMKNISEAAAKNMGNTINQEFGQNDFLGNMMKEGINMKMNRPGAPSGPFRPATAMPQGKMNGPSGIDDILNELNTGRDDESVSSHGSSIIRSSAKRNKNGKKSGIQLDLR